MASSKPKARKAAVHLKEMGVKYGSPIPVPFLCLAFTDKTEVKVLITSVTAEELGKKGIKVEANPFITEEE